MACGRPASHSGWIGLSPPGPGGFVAASQIACGRPASHSAWIGLSPPGAGIGSMPNASQISCGRPASHAGCSGLAGSVGPPGSWLLRHLRSWAFAFFSAFFLALSCFLAFVSFLSAVWRCCAPCARFFAFLAALTFFWAFLTAFLALVTFDFCFAHPALADVVAWAVLDPPVWAFAPVLTAPANVRANATHPASTSF